MKRFIITITLFTTTFLSFSQSLEYQDLAILFSQNDNNGSARFTAMSAAFGALGGDISSINVNPAGLSVFKNSTFSGTFNSRNSEITSNYYGNSNTNQDQFINISHAGAVLVFDSAYSKDWSKFAIGFSYRIKKDFNDLFLSEGNSNRATFTEYPLDTNDPTFVYDIADKQRYVNTNSGELSELNVGFSSIHQNKLHVGLSLNFYDLNFTQRSTLTEFNSDANGNQLDANFYQENYTTGAGFSLNAGFIYKAHQNFRFGLAYQTPTWYTEIAEESNIINNDGFFGDTEIIVSNDNLIYDNTSGGFFPSQGLIYRLKTPSQLTASAALIFGKNGLLSIDYVSKNYKNIKLSGDDFSVENQFFQNGIKNTHNVRLGTEWRFDRLSIRGGLSKKQTPNVNNILNEDSIVNYSDAEGYSFGAGYNFGNFKLDFAYSDNNRTATYNMYPGFNVNPSNLTIDNKIFTATVTLDL
ncbi:hemin receptor [uncultured Polaribacter sp.]|jgi:hypothetical protein|uniref:OmpP1/FadL family transporter n=1 Tax=uncultured Polaribacter sp. TaxID=174711 RepID=UPI00263A0B56|nr:hemin receptor [uncultured Polaribacter sp.]